MTRSVIKLSWLDPLSVHVLAVHIFVRMTHMKLSHDFTMVATIAARCGL